MSKNLIKYRNLFLKILISSVLIWLVFTKVDKGQLVSNLKLLDLQFVPLIIILIVLNYIVSSYRWKALLIFKNSDKVSVAYLTSLYFIGSFFNNFMPTSIGGDVYKIFKLGKKIDSTTSAFSATFMERFTGVLMLILISIISLVSILGFRIILLFIWLGMGFYLGIKLFKTLAARFKIIKKFYDSLMLYRNQKKVLFSAVMTSLVVQFISIMSQYFIFMALGFKIPLFYALFTFPLITLASFLVPSLNGIGVQDYLYTNIFAFVAIPVEVSLSASILYHLFRLGVSLIGGVLYAAGKAD